MVLFSNCDLRSSARSGNHVIVVHVFFTVHLAVVLNERAALSKSAPPATYCVIIT